MGTAMSYVYGTSDAEVAKQTLDTAQETVDAKTGETVDKVDEANNSDTSTKEEDEVQDEVKEEISTKPLRRSYREKHTIEYRKRDTRKALKEYPDRVPVIVETSPNADEDIPIITKNKYIIPDKLSVVCFVTILKHKLDIKSKKKINLYVNGTVLKDHDLISAHYRVSKEDDGYLYIEVE